MSINVTISGNPLNVRRGRMVLSDLDQIKKNERDRRRRLRLEQVRQQSKEISTRLLERAKKLARQELDRLEKDGRSELRQMHDRKIMEIQQKYQEDMEDIGQAHASAAVQLDANVILESEKQRNRIAAAKRAKEAVERIKEAEQIDSPRTVHQDRLRRVREVENLRSSMVAGLSKKSPGNEQSDESCLQEEESVELTVCQRPKKKKGARLVSKKSAGKIVKSPAKIGGSNRILSSPCRQKSYKIVSPKATKVHKQPVACSSVPLTSETRSETDRTEHVVNSSSDDQMPRETVPVSSIVSVKTGKPTRYNPEDYTQDTPDSSSTDSSSTISDDSSYFSDSGEQSKCVKTPKHHTSLAGSKVRLYDHSTHQRNAYEKPAGVVERIDVRNEPNAIEAAREIEQAESLESQLAESRKVNAQRRGEDAILREKVRRDYQALMQHLDHLAREERKLKASQMQKQTEDVHLREHRRKELQEEHQRKLDRAFKNLLNKCCTPSECARLQERVITLPPREEKQTADTVPCATWQEPPFVAKSTAEKEQPEEHQEILSREEQILDMLKKVERQKRLLLQEFGADLPSDIFTASMRPLFETDASVVPSKAPTAEQPVSPEIKVINMSDTCDENAKKKSGSKKKSTPHPQKTETAVQTASEKDDATHDKSIQVELTPEKSQSSDLEKQDVDTEPVRHHPIEPKITVITPEVDDSSSGSASSVVTGVVIDVNKTELKVTPKKKKGVSKVFRRASPSSQKSHSLPSSTATSSMKRYSKSLPGSRLTSPKKPTCSSTSTPRRKIDISVNKAGFNIKVAPPENAKIAIDASTETSQSLSPLETHGQLLDKPCRMKAQNKKTIRIRDTSDTSTSFASPPPVVPRTILDGKVNNATPILEMLDSSINESMKMLRDVSPVSTPETPSPRTMMMPSNIPRPNKITRVLKYTSTDSQTNDTTISSFHNDHSSSTDPSDYHHERIIMSERITGPSRPMPATSCSCTNPECKLLHVQLDDALRNCPEILKKYEDLQNMCTERIASLTDLIARVRNEQRGMEFSMISPADETSLMQLPPVRPARSDLQSVRKLLESIEAIHNQLAKTLMESQRIMTNETTMEESPSRNAEIQLPTSSARENKSTGVTERSVEEAGVSKNRAKPRIISEERVNIQLNRFKVQQRPRMAASTPERKSWPPQGLSMHEEDLVEKLSKEILEQSKGLDKSCGISSAIKNLNDSFMKQQTLSAENVNGSINDVSLKTPKSSPIAKDEGSSQEPGKEKDFVPLLAGIPKVPRTLANVSSINGRGKPPVTLLSGPYRVEMESSGHELSTIIEFDTPDTANKSSANVRSPTKCKDTATDTTSNAQKSPVKKTAETQAKCSVKPSVHVAPLPAQHGQQQAFRKSHDIPSAKTSPEVAISVCTSHGTAALSNSEEKRKDAKHGVLSRNEVKKPTDVPEKSNKELQCDTVDERLSSREKDAQLVYSTDVDRNGHYKDNKDKVTSTSINSFSGLSGISEITSTPSSDVLKYASSPEEMEIALKKLGLSWAITTLKKTREASALSSSSNSDVTPLNTARRMISPTKKQFDSNACGLPDLSDVSSISIKEASKSTEQAVLLKGRTSTPKLQNSNSNSERSNCSTSISSGTSSHEQSDSLTVPNVSLAKPKASGRQLESL